MNKLVVGNLVHRPLRSFMSLVCKRKPPRATMDKSTGVAPQTLDKSKLQLGLFFALMTVVPLLFILCLHVWLRSAYTRNVFHQEGFIDLYGSSIYRYRILGRYLLLSIYRFLATHYHDRPFPLPRDVQGTFFFYFTYVLINAVFFFFSNLILLIMMWDWKRGITDLRLAAYFFLVLVFALSTYVVTPYDQISFFFMFVGFISVKISNPRIMYFVLGIAAIAGTLNRETEFLVSPALLTVGFFAKSAASRRYYQAGLYHLALFTACYLALRIFTPGAPAVSAGITFGGKWAVASLAVVSAIFYIGVVLAVREYFDFRPVRVLLLLSAPYLVTILLSGEIRELRLLLPLLLCLFFVHTQLAHLNIGSSLSANAGRSCPTPIH